MFLARIFDGFTVRRRRLQTSRLLASLSDSQLKDIGLSRFDLFDPRWSR